MAEGYKFSNGKALVAFYIPLPLSMTFLMGSCWKRSLTRKSIKLAFLLYLLLIVPFYSYLLETYDHHLRDDAFRYRIASTHIAQSKTLWEVMTWFITPTEECTCFNRAIDTTWPHG
jgi:hypothetical protein